MKPPALLVAARGSARRNELPVEHEFSPSGVGLRRRSGWLVACALARMFPRPWLWRCSALWGIKPMPSSTTRRTMAGFIDRELDVGVTGPGVSCDVGQRLAEGRRKRRRRALGTVASSGRRADRRFELDGLLGFSGHLENLAAQARGRARCGGLDIEDDGADMAAVRPRCPPPRSDAVGREGPAPSGAVARSDSPTANRRWMTPPCRSRRCVLVRQQSEGGERRRTWSPRATWPARRMSGRCPSPGRERGRAATG